jgi:hypothetical protein
MTLETLGMGRIIPSWAEPSWESPKRVIALIFGFGGPFLQIEQSDPTSLWQVCHQIGKKEKRNDHLKLYPIWKPSQICPKICKVSTLGSPPHFKECEEITTLLQNKFMCSLSEKKDSMMLADLVQKKTTSC